jgi:indole-3-pyruvate monooxygenase
MPAATGAATHNENATLPALDALVIGAGPAGLATAACLAQRGIEALVLEAGPALGSSWRNHYDRLHLHTVKGQSHLPGLPFAKDLPRYPSRAQMVAYLESYAAHFGVVPRTGEAVRRVRASAAADVAAVGGGLVVETERAVYRARAVVVATGYNRVPNPERLPAQDSFRGAVIHSARYRNAGPFANQAVLVVGAGNTGAEIALDLAEHGARPTLALRTPVNVVPRDFLGLPTQVTSIRMRKAPLGLADAIGRLVSRLAFGNLARYGLARPALGPLSAIKLRRRIPLIDVGTIAAIKRGAIAVKPAVERFTEAGAVFADGSVAEFDAAVMATGFRPALEEIVAVPGVLDPDGYPRDRNGGGACPNLFFVGYANVATGLLRELAIDAQAVAADIAGQHQARAGVTA